MWYRTINKNNVYSSTVYSYDYMIITNYYNIYNIVNIIKNHISHTFSPHPADLWIQFHHVSPRPRPRFAWLPGSNERWPKVTKKMESQEKHVGSLVGYRI